MTYGWKPWDKAKYNCTNPACLPVSCWSQALTAPCTWQHTGPIKPSWKSHPTIHAVLAARIWAFSEARVYQHHGFQGLYLLELELSHSHQTFLGSTSPMKIILKLRHFFPLKVDFVSSFDCRICNKSTFQESLLLIVLGISCEQTHILFDSSKINFKGQLTQISLAWQHFQMQNSRDNI